MKKVIVLIIVFLATNDLIAQSSIKELRHVVLFGWKQGADTNSINKAIQAFGELPKQINSIKKYEWGINNSPEKLNQGLTHCFVLTFSSEKDRDDYLVHPVHVAFTKLLPNILDKVTVLDYWVTSLIYN
ncbi:MAG: Dabb family protein [Sediminibacterium sp.]